jgi:hypothetical protein
MKCCPLWCARQHCLLKISEAFRRDLNHMQPLTLYISHLHSLWCTFTLSSTLLSLFSACVLALPLATSQTISLTCHVKTHLRDLIGRWDMF